MARLLSVGGSSGIADIQRVTLRANQENSAAFPSVPFSFSVPIIDGLLDTLRAENTSIR